jgi:hypothetical protein
MFKIEYQNNNKYCPDNPNKNHNHSLQHFYINNNCKYCKCSKFVSVGIFEYIFTYIFRLRRL